jgi:hypothetical protein
VVGTALLVSVSGLVALKTGEAEEDTVEAVVAERAIHDHEEAAERFLMVSWIVLGIAVVGALPGVAGRGGRALTLVGSLALAYFGWRVGDLGGKLAYQKGAASAYTQTVRGGDDEHEGK